MSRAAQVGLVALALAVLLAIWLLVAGGVAEDPRALSRQSELAPRAELSGDADALSAAAGGPRTLDAPEAHPLLRTQRDASSAPWRDAGLVLRGRVEDAQGAALPGVEIVVTREAAIRGIASIVEQIRAQSAGGASVPTDAQGRFELRGLPEGPLLVRARSAAGAQTERSGVHAWRAEEGARELVLRFERGLSLSLTFRDVAARPLPGRHLALLLDLEDGELSLQRFALTTDHEGAARIDGLPPGRYSVLAFPAASLIHVLRDNLRLSTDTHLELAESATGRLEVEARDEAGAPIAGAEVLALVGGGGFAGLVHGTTGLDGRFDVERSPLGKIEIAFVRAPGYVGWPATPAALGTHEIRADRPYRLQVRLRSAGPVNGRAWLGDGARPLAGAELLFRATNDPRAAICARATTDREGRFASAALPRERLHVEVRAEDRAPIAPRVAPLEFFADRKTGAEAWAWLELSNANATGELELRVPPPGALAGEARDERGRALAGVPLVASIDLRGFESRLVATSDAEGRFRFEGLHTPATWTIAPLEERDRGAPLRVTLAAGERRTDLHLSLAAPRRLRGRVSSGGVPIPGARIALQIVGAGRAAHSLRSDAAGEFVVEIAADKVELRVEAAGHLRWSGELEARDGVFPFREIELPLAVDLFGVVRDEQGAPFPDAQLRWLPREAVLEGVQQDLRQRTRASGEFRFGALLHGPGRLIVNARQHLPSELEIEDPTLASPVEITLRRGLSVRGQVCLPDGAPAAQHPVIARTDKEQEIAGTTGADGSFEIGGLEPGRVRLQALVPRDTAAQLALSPSATEEVEAGSAGVLLRLRAAAPISGLLQGLDLSVHELAALEVVAHAPKDLAVLGRSKVGENAAFHVGGLEPGQECLLVIAGLTTQVRRRAYGPFVAGTQGLVLELEVGAALRGRVVDREGKPLERLQLRVEEHEPSSPRGPELRTRTAKDGRFTILGCPLTPVRLLVELPTQPPRVQVVENLVAGSGEIEITVDG